MIVDDHAVIRRMIRAVFEAEGWKVFDAANGAEGVEKAQQVKPSLIILDLTMPVMNGLEAARRLKALMPHIPLLMFTNHGGMVEKSSLRGNLCFGLQGRLRCNEAIACPCESDGWRSGRFPTRILMLVVVKTISHFRPVAGRAIELPLCVYNSAP